MHFDDVIFHSTNTTFISFWQTEHYLKNTKNKEILSTQNDVFFIYDNIKSINKILHNSHCTDTLISYLLTI